MKISGLEVQNKKSYWVYISKESFANLLNGMPINIALKNYSLDIKEFLICGFAPTSDSIFVSKRIPIQKAFITNAVANSIVFYAITYLNNKGLSLSEIRDIKAKYSFKNIETRFFCIDELKASFINQSVFFLKLYQEMNNNNCFEYFVDYLEQQNRFKDVFKHYKDPLSLKIQYNRRIFHDKLECFLMRSNYEEETFHKNTGVFNENNILKSQNYYIIDKQYLLELRMRLCKSCQGS
ncbi:hypothetical protein [Parabacteroides sp. PF5-9]|uniref:hypothetical protein n=1 Tax=Parabacteroides sp. PF5-9 TaxID=1742404 RepID=UPI002475F211|nr:hypothetical protein [Parabacteroides sp. PF5-9]MDH6357984.1 hypothetical protein [Parabacteroides sp. PF5-9]